MSEISHAELLGLNLDDLERERFTHPAQVLRDTQHRYKAQCVAEWRQSRLSSNEDIRERELNRLADRWAGGELGA